MPDLNMTFIQSTYSPIIYLFVSHLTGLEKSLISQYITAQQFLFLISDIAVIDIKVFLYISEDYISINFKNFVDVESDNKEFMTVIIPSDDTLRFSTYHGDLLLDFETAYNRLIKHIERIVDPELLSFSHILGSLREAPVIYCRDESKAFDFSSF